MEIWKSIFEGYEVSSYGRVRSVDRVSYQVRHGKMCEVNFKGKVRATSLDANGYERVCLWNGNRQHGYIVHRLVVEAFLRPIESEEEVNHIDFNRANNRLSNLEILPIRANTSYSTDGGRKAKKLTEEQVRQIKFESLWGEDQRDLAGRFGVSSTMIRKIVSEEYWQRVNLQDLARHD